MIIYLLYVIYNSNFGICTLCYMNNSPRNRITSQLLLVNKYQHYAHVHAYFISHKLKLEWHALVEYFLCTQKRVCNIHALRSTLKVSRKLNLQHSKKPITILFCYASAGTRLDAATHANK